MNTSLQFCRVLIFASALSVGFAPLTAVASGHAKEGKKEHKAEHKKEKKAAKKEHKKEHKKKEKSE